MGMGEGETNDDVTGSAAQVVQARSIGSVTFAAPQAPAVVPFLAPAAPKPFVNRDDQPRQHRPPRRGGGTAGAARAFGGTAAEAPHRDGAIAAFERMGSPLRRPPPGRTRHRHRRTAPVDLTPSQPDAEPVWHRAGLVSS